MTSCTSGMLFLQYIICCYICYVQLLSRSSFTMELSYFISLIFIFILNVLFFFSGICLNSLVILSFWRSSQLRKKLCYFMIMVLSCCDLLAVLTNNSLVALITMLWLTGMLDVYPSWAAIPLKMSSFFLIISIVALFVMSFDRYLATYYPIFHRTSVTKGKLLTLFAILSILELLLELLSATVISRQAHSLICLIIFFPSMIFINYKLFIIARKSRRNNAISAEIKKTLSLKKISSCLLAVACILVLTIPWSVYIALGINSKETTTLSDNKNFARLWNRTFFSMNSTCNCLIFYWKNKILRSEGMKLIKGMKLCRRLRSQSEDY